MGTLVSSGSSLNMPTGSGSERLRRLTYHNNNASTIEILSGTAGHIYTIISIIFCSVSNSVGTIDIKVNDGSNDVFVVRAQTHSGYESFVFNERIVLEEDDDLDVYNSVADGDWYVSYIDQDWT
jgi:hypothetical protein